MDALKTIGCTLALLTAASSPLVGQGIPRFAIGGDDSLAIAAATHIPPGEAVSIGLRGPARPGAYVADMGRRAALLGDETGAFEVWVWPLKLVRDLRLAFRIPEYDAPIEGASVARDVIVRPEGLTILYRHATFTVRQHVLVPMDEPGAVILLDVETVRPLEVLVQMHADFNLAWPGSFGGGYITWQETDRRFLLSQGGVRLYNALIGSPFASDGTTHAAHDAPTIPSQFTLRFDPARTETEFIPIVIAGAPSANRDSVTMTYDRLLANAERYWREKVDHYRAVREDQLTIDTPDPRLDLALEWAKVNLDQQLVCNPDLGCGLVAGFGRAGAGNFRPGFGWFFGGDAAINSFAMDGLGQFDLVRTGLEFLARYQRDDGKITHEISQAAARLPWFTDYPYTFFHGDTTPFWIQACYEYWKASGDRAFLDAQWSRIERAFRWSLSTDTDGDGLMENPTAGAGAIEVGGLGEALWTDVYLAGVWTASLAGIREMAAARGDRRTENDAARALGLAQATLEREFWLENAGIYAFALLQNAPSQSGRPRTNDALTAWPTTAMTFGLLDIARADRMLARIASPDMTTDWGVRMLSSGHPLYDPLHYNNGTVWPFVTGFVALAHYRYHRAADGLHLVRAVAGTTFDFALGRNPELLSGAFYRPLDTAVPQQFFATSMLVSPLVRGLFGIEVDAPRGTITLMPHLPPDWDRVAVRNIRAGSARLALEISQVPGRTTVQIEGSGSTGGHALTVRVAPALPAGARLTSVLVNGQAVQAETETTLHDVHATVEVTLDGEARIEFEYRIG
jgi:glycogen debranching enzyme